MYICGSHLKPVQRALYWEHVWVTALNDTNTKNCIFPFHWLDNFGLHLPCSRETGTTAQLMCASKTHHCYEKFFIISECQGLDKIFLCDQTLIFILIGKIYILFGKKNRVSFLFFFDEREWGWCVFVCFPDW